MIAFVINGAVAATTGFTPTLAEAAERHRAPAASGSRAQSELLRITVLEV